MISKPLLPEKLLKIAQAQSVLHLMYKKNSVKLHWESCKAIWSKIEGNHKEIALESDFLNHPLSMF